MMFSDDFVEDKLGLAKLVIDRVLECDLAAGEMCVVVGHKRAEL
jgi:hypothetical protein